MVIKTKNLVLICFVWLLLSYIVAFFAHATSSYFGVTITLLFIYAFGISTSLRISRTLFNNIAILLAIIFLSGFYSAIVNSSSFDVLRFGLSFLLLIIMLGGAITFTHLIDAIDFKSFHKIVRFIFILLLCDGLISGIKLTFFGDLRLSFFEGTKPMILFYEPSLFALFFGPALLYIILQKQKENRRWIHILSAGIATALLLQSLTLMVSIVVFLIIQFNVKRLLLLALAVVLAILFLPIDYEYYLSRLRFSSGNLSVLAFLSGWERAFLAIKSTIFGVGFNQFGIVGDKGILQEKLRNLGFYGLNLLDGTSNASKIVAELGVLGVVLIIAYLFYWVKFQKLFQSGHTLGNKDLFFMVVFLSYIVELFVRGVGYLTPSTFLFLTSCVYISKNYSRIKL